MKHTILCVDDEQDNVEALERLFRAKYTVLKATSGHEALAILDQNPGTVSVIITDQRMPGMTGVQLLEKSMTSQPDAVRILLTGYTDIDSIIKAINSGQVYRYINKPWDVIDLTSTIDRAIEKYNLSFELKKKNQELAKALTDLQSLDIAKNRFMILINHELKTPLTTISSFVQLLQETHLNEEQEVCLKRITKGADKLKTIIDDVLLIVQGEMGIIKTKIAQVQCNQFKINIPDDAMNLADQKKLKTILRWVDKNIVCDKDLIEQVFSRLLHNAVKFSTENSSVNIAVTLSQAHRAKFSISNIGPKIPELLIKKILQPFFLDEDVMKHSVGMGLGLTICQSILKSHTSSLNIKNTDIGVDISFELPFV